MKKKKLIVFMNIIIIFVYIFSGCSKNKETVSSQSSDKTESKDTGVSTQPTTNPKSNDTTSKDQDKDTSDDETVSSSIESNNNYSDNLCTDNEEIIFSFKIADSDKILSICTSNDNEDYIVYRYGTKDDIEFEFPEDKDASWSKFTYSYYFRGGGASNDGVDSNYITFENGEYKYQIYQEYAAESEETNVGIRVTNLKTNKETDMKGVSSSIEGSLINLRDNTKIKIENQ